MYYIRLKDDRHNRRWKVREAVSLKAAVAAVQHAMVTGSIGHTDTLQNHIPGLPWAQQPKPKTLANVIRVNSDNTEAEAYKSAY